MIALILGGAPSVFTEAKAAAALLNRRHVVVAANLAGIHFPGRLDGWASLHSEHMARWSGERRGNADCRLFTPTPAMGIETNIAAERWSGSSGLYAAQVALFEMRATAAILCGVPMDSGAGHFDRPGSWESVTSYRLAFAAALPVIGARVRSMGGWTADLFGSPTPAWLNAIDNIKPLGVTRPPAEKTPMHTVTNTSKETQAFWADDDQGVRRLHRLAPGKSVSVNVDPAQPKFAKGAALKIVAPPASAKTAPPRPPAEPGA